MTLIHLLYTLNYLYIEVSVVYTGLVSSLPSKTLTCLSRLIREQYSLVIEDETILSIFKQDKLDYPSPRKVDRDRIIYKSRKLLIPELYSRLVLYDFGEAYISSTTYYEDIQSYVYRAPKVVLLIRQDSKVDIQNARVLVSSLYPYLEINLIHSQIRDL